MNINDLKNLQPSNSENSPELELELENETSRQVEDILKEKILSENTISLITNYISNIDFDSDINSDNIIRGISLLIGTGQSEQAKSKLIRKLLEEREKEEGHKDKYREVILELAYRYKWMEYYE